MDARLKVALEFQRCDYTDTHAFGNPVDLLYQGKPLGSDNGPGFGWKNQHVSKLGLSYALLPTLTARAGFSYSNVVLRRSQTSFNLLAPGTPKYHYTMGLTAALDPASELSLFATLSQRNQVSGEHSIPPPLGGGEANIRFCGYNVGVSCGRRFGSAH